MGCEAPLKYVVDYILLKMPLLAWIFSLGDHIKDVPRKVPGEVFTDRRQVAKNKIQMMDR